MSLAADVVLGREREHLSWIVSLFKASLLPLLIVVACSNASTVAAGSIAPESAKVTWELLYETDGPPVALELGQLRADGKNWGSHDVTIRGAQIEYVVDIELPSDMLHAEGTELLPMEPVTPQIVRLQYDRSVQVQIALPDELPAGEHVFDLVLPVWINNDAPGTSSPDDRITARLTYVVQSLEEQAAVASFCAESVPLTNGRVPTLAELDQLVELSQSELEPEQHRSLVAATEELAQDLVAFQAGQGGSYDTGPVNDIVGHLCNVEMLSEAAVAD